MVSRFGKNLHLCLTKIKRPGSLQPSAAQMAPEDCSRPSQISRDTTTSSIFIKNFNSLYDSTSNSKYLSLSSDDHTSSESDIQSAATTPDFAAVFASQRFFFSSPGRSNSIVDSSSSSPRTIPPESDPLGGGGIAIPTYSPDPFKDFRRSMQEMVEARDLIDVIADWDYLHDLLLCYLSLNPKSTHKFIVRAFADLLVTLMTAQEAAVDCELS